MDPGDVPRIPERGWCLERCEDITSLPSLWFSKGVQLRVPDGSSAELG